MVHTWRKLSHIRQTLREEHGGVCFGWEFVPQGKLLYILDGDNVRHGLNCDLSFKAERAENIMRIGSMDRRNEEDDTYNCPSPFFKFGSQEGSNIELASFHSNAL